MNKVFIIGVWAFLLAACGGSGDSASDETVAKNPEDSLFQQVMEGHDEAMAKIGKLRKYRKTFDEKLDSLKKVKSSAKAGLTEAYSDVSEKLKTAEEKMNTWMDEFSIDSAQDDMERRLKYLTDEKFKVDDVRDEIMSALSRADSLLKK